MMGHIFNLAAAVLLLASAASCREEQEEKNSLALPDCLYILEGVSADLYSESFVRRWDPYDFHVRYSGSCRFDKRIPRCATVSSAADGDWLEVSLIDAEDFSLIQSDTVALKVGKRDCGKGKVNVQVLGDSFVDGAFYRAALLDSAYVPGIRMVGLRNVRNTPGHYDEGRGGWTLASYFTVSRDEFSPYSGYMQPAGDMRYWGATAFWKNCHKVETGQITDFEARYACGRFTDHYQKFCPQTGLLLEPAEGDLMWDCDRYVVYDGEDWTDAGEIKDWSFDYGKYLEMWDLEKPDFLFETLGLNDFRYGLDADYSEWDVMIEKMKDSYLEAVPNGIFAIVIPCSSCGLMENRRGDYTLFQNRCMWQFRKHLVEAFSGREAEGFHLVDMGITIDNATGYNVDAEGLQTGNPHPYPNYPTMGVPLAAFVQYHRERL